MKTTTVTWDDYSGRHQERTVNLELDVTTFKQTPGFIWLVIAANPHLSATDICDYVTHFGKQHWRSASWIGRHRWLFRQPDEESALGPKRNTDGHDERAFRLMRDNPRLSSRKMAYFLRKHGVRRSAEWVRLNRVTPYTPGK